IFIGKNTVSVLILIFEIARLITIFGCFGFFADLPYANAFIMPVSIWILTYEPAILNIICFFLTDYIAVLIQNVDHIAIKTLDFPAIQHEDYGRGPFDITLTDNISCEGKFEAFIFHFT